MDKPISKFYEDWDGETILGDVRSFKDPRDFLKQAQEYVLKNRGTSHPIAENYKVRAIIANNEGWIYADIGKGKINGDKIAVYETDILYDFEYYTFSEKEQDKIDTALKEIELRVKTDLPDMDIWNIPLLCYKEDLDDYQKAEVRKVFSQKRERGEWS